MKIGEATLPSGKAVRLVNPTDPHPDPEKVYVATEIIAVVDRADPTAGIAVLSSASALLGQRQAD